MEGRPMLEVTQLKASYGDTQVLFDVDLSISKGEFIAVLGPNGTGKTTLLRALSGFFDNLEGSVVFKGEDITSLPPDEITRKGMCHVQESDAIFTDMTIIENLLVGSYPEKARKKRSENLELVFDIFPRLNERQQQRAGTLSGGERKMLSVAKGLMSDPDLLMLDEPSAGLAPNLVEEMFERIQQIRRETGKTILLVEQRVIEALEVVDRAYILENGRVGIEGDADEVRRNSSVQEAYLGI